MRNNTRVVEFGKQAKLPTVNIVVVFDSPARLPLPLNPVHKYRHLAEAGKANIGQHDIHFLAIENYFSLNIYVYERILTDLGKHPRVERRASARPPVLISTAGQTRLGRAA